MGLPNQIPAFDVPLMDENGIMNTQWYLFFYNIGKQTFANLPASQTVTVTGSPFTFTAAAAGALFITGGKGVVISLIRYGVTVASNIVVGGFGAATGSIPVGAGDQVIIKYAAVPTVVFMAT